MLKILILITATSEKEDPGWLDPSVIVAIVGGVAAVAVAYLTYLGIKANIKKDERPMGIRLRRRTRFRRISWPPPPRGSRHSTRSDPHAPSVLRSRASLSSERPQRSTRQSTHTFARSRYSCSTALIQRRPPIFAIS